METLRRRALILDYLCTKSEESAITITELHEYFKSQYRSKKDRKTFSRDIEVLSLDHQIIEVDENKRTKRYYAKREKKSSLQNIKIQNKDLFTLITALSTFKQTAPKTFAKSCDDILMSISQNLKDKDLEQFDLIKSITTSTQGIDGRSVALIEEDFEKLIKAIINQQCFKCRISYPLSAPKEEKKYMPLAFYFTNNTPYLYALDLVKNENRLLRATRLTQIELLDQKSNPKLVNKALMEVGPHFSGFGGKTEIRYEITCDTAFATFFLERPFVSPFKFEQSKKDNIITFTLNDNEQIIRLLASWAPHIKDIKPKAIKQKVLETLKKGQENLK
ncbi:MAG: hypothetical protein OHK0056_33330 [Bacteriovoracaceae bacterium]